MATSKNKDAEDLLAGISDSDFIAEFRKRGLARQVSNLDEIAATLGNILRAGAGGVRGSGLSGVGFIDPALATNPTRARFFPDAPPQNGPFVQFLGGSLNGRPKTEEPLAALAFFNNLLADLALAKEGRQRQGGGKSNGQGSIDLSQIIPFLQGLFGGGAAGGQQ